jgi:hypothetical protein
MIKKLDERKTALTPALSPWRGRNRRTPAYDCLTVSRTQLRKYKNMDEPHNTICCLVKKTNGRKLPSARSLKSIISA